MIMSSKISPFVQMHAAYEISYLCTHCFYISWYAISYSCSKSLNREYEMGVLTHGDFDERVFLHPSASQEIGTPVGGVNFRSSMAVHTPPRHVQFGTPLLGREMLGNPECSLTPASEATNSVAQLHMLLENCPPEPTEVLVRMCESCPSNPLADIKERVKRLSDSFIVNSPEASSMCDTIKKNNV